MHYAKTPRKIEGSISELFVRPVCFVEKVGVKSSPIIKRKAKIFNQHQSRHIEVTFFDDLLGSNRPHRLHEGFPFVVTHADASEQPWIDRLL